MAFRISSAIAFAPREASFFAAQPGRQKQSESTSEASALITLHLLFSAKRKKVAIYLDDKFSIWFVSSDKKRGRGGGPKRIGLERISG